MTEVVRHGADSEPGTQANLKVVVEPLGLTASATVSTVKAAALIRLVAIVMIVLGPILVLWVGSSLMAPWWVSVALGGSTAIGLAVIAVERSQF